jgi:hypothetical protein
LNYQVAKQGINPYFTKYNQPANIILASKLAIPATEDWNENRCSNTHPPRIACPIVSTHPKTGILKILASGLLIFQHGAMVAADATPVYIANSSMIYLLIVLYEEPFGLFIKRKSKKERRLRRYALCPSRIHEQCNLSP